MDAELHLFRTVILRDLRHNWVRTGITVLGIALGVSVMLAISLANQTALSKFKETVDLVSGKANLEIHGRNLDWVDERLLGSLDWLWMAGAKFTPIIQKTVVYADSDRELVQFLGIDMLADPEFKTYAESQTETDKSSAAPSILAQGSVLIGERLARDHHLKPGDRFSLLINEKPQPFAVAGVLSGAGLGGVFTGEMVVGDLATVQTALAMPGKVTQIELIAPPDSLSLIKEKLQAELPDALEVVLPSSRGAQVEKMTRSFEYNLMALTFIALLVGMFLIYNTMTISVLRRRQDIGTLRAIGMRRAQVMRLFALEALWFGLVGTTFGISFGLAMADQVLKAVASTFQHFYFQDPIESIALNPWALVWAFLTGNALTMIASLPPLFEATDVAPAEATRRASYESKITRLARPFALIGAVLLVIGVLASFQDPVENFPLFGYVAALSAILSWSAFLPLMLKVALPVAARLFARLNLTEGELAARSLLGTLGRTSVAIAGLTTGIAMMVSLAIMIGSFRQTVLLWVDQSLKADLWLQSVARASGSRQARFSQAIVDEVAADENVDATDGFVETPIEFKGEPAFLAAGDLSTVAKQGKLIFISGESCQNVLARMNEHSAIVSETFANRKHMKRGQTVEIPTADGSYSVRIEGVYYDYASDLGYIVIDRPVFEKLFGDNTLSSCAIYLKAGADPYRARAALLKKLSKYGLFQMRTTGELRKEAARVFDRTFAITYALHTIAIAVALLSVMNALFALTLESKREFGILRYLGASRTQLRRLVLTEAGLLGIFGNVGGVILGFVLSLLLIFVINKQSFGWTVKLTIPAAFLAQSSLLVIVTAIISGIIPAQMAANTPAPEVVREE